MRLASPAFRQGGEIPRKFTGEGEDVSPPLEWSRLPPDARELALVCEDPDAPRRPGTDHPFVHWVIYGIPLSERGLPEAIEPRERLRGDLRVVQGTNSFGWTGYSGPMPPEGHGVHHYRFRLFALDEELGLEPGMNRDELMAAIEGHVVATAECVGTFERGAMRKVA